MSKKPELYWIKEKEIPEFDGEYLCHIVRRNECGTFSKVQKVVSCLMNKWVIEPNERVTHYMIVPPPQRSLSIQGTIDTAHKEIINRLISFEVDRAEDFREKEFQIASEFIITKRGYPFEEATKDFIEDIIDWENGRQFSSLEKTLDEKYNVSGRPSLPNI